ncbi:MAG: virulence RhuM family protein [Fibromonadaceae bacterium]|nr:virulence RhuM family protein [Fibromonadaceae bacterium]
MSKSVKKNREITIRSSAAEYLQFLAASGENSIEVMYKDENIWLTQKMMAELYRIDRSVITKHLKKIFTDSELEENSVCAIFAHTAEDGKIYETKFYSLEAIIAVGYKVDNERAVQFRKWATIILKTFTVKAWVMDDERIKAGGSILIDRYFSEQLERIREIRISERLFYQKITDIYTTSMDYDPNSQTTKDFFAMVQNKMHFAVHRHTAAEIIIERANAKKTNMGLTSWKYAPNGKIYKFDVSIAKNYLNEEELDYLERIVTLYLDFAELQAKRKIPMTMEDWSQRLDGFLEFNGNKILKGQGKISHEQAKLFAESEWEKYRIVQDKLFQNDFDKLLSLEKF